MLDHLFSKSHAHEFRKEQREGRERKRRENIGGGESRMREEERRRREEEGKRKEKEGERMRREKERGGKEGRE